MLEYAAGLAVPLNVPKWAGNIFRVFLRGTKLLNALRWPVSMMSILEITNFGINYFLKFAEMYQLAELVM